MDFSFSDEQRVLEATARAWASDTFGRRIASRLAAGALPPSAEAWRDLAQLGWLGIIVPPELGGSGGSLVDGCLIAEALAGSLAPVPFVGNALIAAAALKLMASPDDQRQHLPLLSGGRSSFSVMLDERLGWPPRAGKAVALEWVPGARTLVPRGGARVTVEPLDLRPLPCQDPLRLLAEAEEVKLEKFEWTDAAERFRAFAWVAASASLLGIMAGALDLAVEHAKSRRQFGQPIGSFQAVQHMCADMLVDVETSRSAVYGAAWAVENLATPAALKAAAVAKVWCSVARRCCETAIQVLGGIGFTWEHDAHLFLRAAHLWTAAFGDATDALSVVARDELGDSSGGGRVWT